MNVTKNGPESKGQRIVVSVLPSERYLVSCGVSEMPIELKGRTIPKHVLDEHARDVGETLDDVFSLTSGLSVGSLTSGQCLMGSFSIASEVAGDDGF